MIRALRNIVLLKHIFVVVCRDLRTWGRILFEDRCGLASTLLDVVVRMLRLGSWRRSVLGGVLLFLVLGLGGGGRICYRMIFRSFRMIGLRLLLLLELLLLLGC